MEITSREQLIEEIADALDMNLDEGCFYLNLTEQAIDLHISNSCYVDEECLWPHDGDEVIRIDPLSSHESFGAMEGFARMQVPKIAEQLYRTLNRRRPFAHFTEMVYTLGLPDEWYAFKNNWYTAKAEEWLRDNGVDFVDGKIVCTGDTYIWKSDEDE
jgi:hypothetical protein